MSGKYYNRSILVHKRMYESLERMRLRSFLCSFTNDYETKVLECIERLRDKYEMISANSLSGDKHFNEILDR